MSGYFHVKISEIMQNSILTKICIEYKIDVRRNMNEMLIIYLSSMCFRRKARTRIRNINEIKIKISKWFLFLNMLRPNKI